MSPRQRPPAAAPPPSEPGADSKVQAEAAQPPVRPRDDLEAELVELNNKYVRLTADFENYRRRRAQESEEQARYGSASLLQALLPGLDNLARAVAHIPADATDGVAEGLRLTVKQLEEALASQGIRRIPAVGETFDPRLHDAVLTVPAGAAPPGTVVAELQPGYQIHDRVVRPAQVSVAESGGDPASGEGDGGVGGDEDAAEARYPN
ncbi:MAG: nucleotide exchange factor GrpE [Candidatus Dormibacteria bacterium]